MTLGRDQYRRAEFAKALWSAATVQIGDCAHSIEARIDNASGDASELRRRIGVQKGRLTKLERKLDEACITIDEQSERLAHASARLQNLMAEHDGVLGAYEDAFQRIEDLQQENRRLKSELAGHLERQGVAIEEEQRGLIDEQARRALGAGARFALLEID